MTPNERFIDAIDTLNKRAYSLVEQNAKGWARYACEKGIISLEECEQIEQYVNLRNTMGHGGMKYITVTEEDVEQVNKYIDIMTNGRRSEPQKEATPPKEVEKKPVAPITTIDMSITGISSRNAAVKLNNASVDLKNIKSTCCDWGDEDNWPSIEIMLRTNKVVTITYNDEATDMDGKTPEDYCRRYKLYFTENGKTYYDYLRATRKMLQNDIARAYDKCDKTSIFLDGLITNAVNMTKIKLDDDCISVTLYDGTLLETQYTRNSIDHKGRSVNYYVKGNSFSVTVDSETQIEYGFAINEMIKADYDYAEDVYRKARTKRR